jgi:tRNA threonylcarbamoyladenosine biosynthesis protein TsaE
MEWITHSTEETIHIGKEIASTLRGGDVLLFYGELGAGKTTLSKGIAEGLGITKDVTSPTFSLMNVYNVMNNDTIKNLIHIDTYRLKDATELVAIGSEEYIGASESVCIIEWPEKVEPLFKNKKVKKIFLEHGDGETRKITL